MPKALTAAERADLLTSYRAQNERRAAERADRARVRENRAAAALLADTPAVRIPDARSADRQDAARTAHRAFVAARNAAAAAQKRLAHARATLHALDAHGTRNARNAAARAAFREGRPDHLTMQQLSKLVRKDALLRYTYGITLTTLENMYDNQHEQCAICHRSFPLEKLKIDHCHTHGHVRELLCQNCNALLGLAQENVDTLLRAIAYLERHAPTKASVEQAKNTNL